MGAAALRWVLNPLLFDVHAGDLSLSLYLDSRGQPLQLLELLTRWGSPWREHAEHLLEDAPARRQVAARLAASLRGSLDFGLLGDEGQRRATFSRILLGWRSGPPLARPRQGSTPALSDQQTEDRRRHPGALEYVLHDLFLAPRRLSGNWALLALLRCLVLETLPADTTNRPLAIDDETVSLELARFCRARCADARPPLCPDCRWRGQPGSPHWPTLAQRFLAVGGTRAELDLVCRWHAYDHVCRVGAETELLWQDLSDHLAEAGAPECPADVLVGLCLELSAATALPRCRRENPCPDRTRELLARVRQARSLPSARIRPLQLLARRRGTGCRSERSCPVPGWSNKSFSGYGPSTLAVLRRHYLLPEDLLHYFGGRYQRQTGQLPEGKQLSQYVLNEIGLGARLSGAIRLRLKLQVCSHDPDALGFVPVGAILEQWPDFGDCLDQAVPAGERLRPWRELDRAQCWTFLIQGAEGPRIGKRGRPNAQPADGRRGAAVSLDHAAYARWAAEYQDLLDDAAGDEEDEA